MLIGSLRPRGAGAFLWPAALIVWGPGAVSARHAHHCVQVVVALNGTLRVRRRGRETWRHCGAVFVRPDADHEIDASGGRVLIAFIDPEGELAAGVDEWLRGDVTCVSATRLSRWRRTLGDPATLDSPRVERWVRALLRHGGRSRSLHPRVARVIRTLRHHPLNRRATSLERLAALAGLSASRFAHVFTESIGIPLRPYLRWLRLQRAAGALMAGSTVTQAAYMAGFADAAHLTRTFRRTLGTTPRELIRRAPAARELRITSA